VLSCRITLVSRMKIFLLFGIVVGVQRLDSVDLKQLRR